MTSNNTYNALLFTTTDQRLLTGEVEREGLCQTRLTSSEAFGSSNPSLHKSPREVLRERIYNKHLKYYQQLNTDPNLDVGSLDPPAQQVNAKPPLNVNNHDNESPQSVNEINTVVNTYDSLQHITPSRQSLVKTEDRFGKSTFTDVSLRFKLIQEDGVEPYLWDLIENGCHKITPSISTSEVSNVHVRPEKEHSARSVNVVDCPPAPEKVRDQPRVEVGRDEQMDVLEGLFLEDSQRFYMGDGSFRNLDKNSYEYSTALNAAKRLHAYCTSVGINPCLSHIGYGWFHVGLDKACPQVLKEAMTVDSLQLGNLVRVNLNQKSKFEIFYRSKV